MASLRRHEGYLIMDNSCSEGVPDEVLAAAGLPIGIGRGRFESAAITCSHCQTIVVLNPGRTRERAYCPKCDHYICDECGRLYALSGGECRPFKQIVDETQEQAALEHQRAQRGIILPPGYKE